ncbi:MAG TPA: PIN/TRAM domain-containing protein [Planctomycetes bacterium]|nr:PIN/TRAM domain-containing protein [Planctomycetota bacterium]
MNFDQQPQLDIPILTLRAIFFLSAAGLGLYLARLAEAPLMEYPAMLIGGMLALLVIFVDMAAIGRSSIAQVSAIVFGLLIGFLAAQLFIGIVSLMGDFEGEVGKKQLNGIRLCLTLIFCYLGPSYLLRTKDDLRFVVPYVEFQRTDSGPAALVLDTSALIDGRIVDLARAYLFDAPFLVTREVVEELQRIADSGDKNRRVRGRRGLDMLKRLQELPHAVVEFPQTTYGDPAAEVDRRLIETAKARNGKLITVDLNLQKVCEVEGVKVINLNLAAQAMQAPCLPGDRISVKVVKPGEGREQGVGYLDDGTMVVIEQAKKLKGQTLSVVVTSAIQSSAGKMIFARIPREDDSNGDEVAGEEASGDAAAETPQAAAAESGNSV